jgi:hypothetical protein
MNTTDQSYLVETGNGLAISRRQDLKAARPSFPTDVLDELMKGLDYFVGATDKEDVLRHYWGKQGLDNYTMRNAVIAAYDDQKNARRNLIRPLKAVRRSRAKNIDDILLKAYLCDVLERFNCRSDATLAHSIVNDLLSAGCSWRAPAS